VVIPSVELLYLNLELIPITKLISGKQYDNIFDLCITVMRKTYSMLVSLNAIQFMFSIEPFKVIRDILASKTIDRSKFRGL